MNVLRLSLLALVGSTLVACGGEKLAANKEAAAQALFAVSNRAQPPSAMASGLTPSVAAQYTQDCTHGGKATLEFSFDDLAGTQTATTTEFDFTVKFDHCNDDGHNSLNGQMATHWALDATDAMSPTLALTFHGRVDISGEVSDFVDANVTQTVNVTAYDTRSGTVSVQLNGTITTSSGTYTYDQNESVSFEADHFVTAPPAS